MKKRYAVYEIESVFDISSTDKLNFVYTFDTEDEAIKYLENLFSLYSGNKYTILPIYS